jgi:hypothetical protein
MLVPSIAFIGRPSCRLSVLLTNTEVKHTAVSMEVERMSLGSNFGTRRSVK